MKFGISTHLYHAERLRRDDLAAIAAHGFECVELFATRSHFDYHDPASIASLGRWLEDTRLEMPSVHAPIVDSLVGDTWGRAYSTASRDVESWQATMREMTACVEIARQIPFKFLVMHLGLPLAQNPGADDNNRDAVVRTIREVYERATPLGVTLALEVMDNRLSTADALVGLIEGDLEDLDLGICMDVGHAHMMGDTADAIETASGYLVTTHLHDNKRQRDDHLVPFEGTLDWPGAIIAFEKIGYDSGLMLEVKNADSAPQVLERCAKARKRLEGLFVSTELRPDSFS